MESGQSVGHTRGGQSLYWQFLGPTTKVCFLEIFSKLFFNLIFIAVMMIIEDCLRLKNKTCLQISSHYLEQLLSGTSDFFIID